MTQMILSGPTLYTDSGIISNGTLFIEHGKIVECREGSLESARPDFLFPSTYSLIPGRIDLHTHGVAGVDVMDATPDALRTMTHMLAQEGTTSFLATTISMPIEKINAAIENVVTFMRDENNAGAKILGIHLEGPFIAPSKMGAHQHDYILKPDAALIKRWQALAKGAIKLVTFAPEVENAEVFLECLLSLNIIPSIGHSNASCETALKAIKKGSRHITHLFNAMSGLHHRHPGVALAALESNVLAEIIADGEHVAWEMIQFAMRVKGRDELCLVTDSMRAKCMPMGHYDLGGQKVNVTRTSARLEDGTLAGSILTMSQAVQNLMQHHICDLSDAIFMSSINPAKQLGIFDEVGSITPGKWADVVVLDENYQAVMTLCRGEIGYCAKR